MKISIVLGPFQPMPPEGFGAVEKVWYELAGAFTQLGHAVILVGKSGGATEHAEAKGFRVVPLRGYAASNRLWLNLLLDFLYAFEVRRRIEPCDIVVTNSFWAPVVLSLLGGGAGKIVVHVARFPKGQMWLYRGTQALQAISSAVAREIVRQTPALEPRVFVLPYPVDLVTYRPPAIARGSDRTGTILYVGRVHPEKGVDLLIRAFRHAIVRVPQMRLRIIGPSNVEQGGAGEAYLDSLKHAASGLPVNFAGPVSDPKVLAAEYAGAQCFCYPSLAEKGEAFGLAVLEAMATGLPVIVSDLACFRDFLEPGRDGLVFDHRAQDPDLRLAECLVQVFSGTELAYKLADGALARAREFELGKVAKRYLVLFEQLHSGSEGKC